RGDFREDLYYRLGGFEIHLPPLRERRDDILAMIQVFLQELGTTIGRPAAGLTREAHDALLSHSWPGNVRELRNVLERATILSDGGLVTLEHLPMGLTRGDGVPAPSAAGEAAADAPGVPAAAASLPAGGGLEAVEREMIVKALAETGNNRSRAARLLGITRSQLYSRLQKHSIDARSTGPDD
ncbi:MAG TPA: helix-turn-helix domain-containing protein, partial [Dongiaceae bacterium]|nr:helix-turn-helix domain-containing protein [Dongiaceae bacterium]